MKTLIDISHIVGWDGRLTGIERTEYHIIKHYYETTDAAFIYWNDENARFGLADKSFVKQAIVDRTSEAEHRQKSRESKNSPFRRLKRRLKPATQSRNDSLPEGRVIILAGLWDNAAYIAALERLAKKRALVHVAYDMIPLVQRGYVVEYLPSVFENYMYKILPLCEAVLAISESTARDTKWVLEEHGLPVPPILTFRLGDDISRAARSVKPAGVSGDFILSVGTIEARKNHMLLYYTYKNMLSKKQQPPLLVLVGKRGWLTADFQYVVEHDSEVTDKIVILDAITDAELRWLYENCLFTVFPSLYEGWGLPIRESLIYGKVTLASNTSSMPEAGGELADYFSPYSTEELAQVITKYLDLKTRAGREALIAKKHQAWTWQAATGRFAAEVQRLD